MDFIKKIFLFLRKLFNKEKDIRMIKESVKTNPEKDKKIFTDSLKIDDTKYVNKKKVETRICVGDGLGIQHKISY